MDHSEKEKVILEISSIFKRQSLSVQGYVTKQPFDKVLVVKIVVQKLEKSGNIFLDP